MANTSKLSKKHVYANAKIQDENFAMRVRIISAVTGKGLSQLTLEGLEKTVDEYEKRNPAFFKKMYDIFNEGNQFFNE